MLWILVARSAEQCMFANLPQEPGDLFMSYNGMSAEHLKDLTDVCTEADNL